MITSLFHDVFRFILSVPQMGRSSLCHQIDQYAKWKAIRHPLVARSHRETLTEFFRATRIPCATLITPETVYTYTKKMDAEYQRQRFMSALRQFMKYWYRMELLTEEFTEVVEPGILKKIDELHPMMHTEQVKRVQALKKDGMSLRQIKLHMETEDNKQYHLRQIQRWASYKLSPPKD